MTRRHAAWVVAGLAGAVGLLKLWDVLEMPPSERRVRRLGRSGPRLLCLHGLFASGAFWLPLARELEGDHQVAIPDLLGFGASPKPEDAAYSVEDHLAWIRPVLDEPGEPWIVAGHSMGCSLAVQAALHHPETVRAVVLFNAPVYSSPERRREIFGRQNILTRASTRSRILGRVICEGSCLLRPIMMRLGPFLRPDLPPEMSADYFRHRWHSYDHSFRNLVLERDLLADLAQVPQPVWVVQGDQDPIAEAPSQLSWPDNVRLQVVPGAHTSLLLQRPEEAARRLRGFEAEVLSAARSLASPVPDGTPLASSAGGPVRINQKDLGRR